MAIRGGPTTTKCAWGSGMRLLVSGLLLCAPIHAAALSYRVLADNPGAWPAVLSSIGLVKGAGDVVVAPAGTAAAPDWSARVERGTILVLEGESPLAASFGFRPADRRD